LGDQQDPVAVLQSRFSQIVQRNFQIIPESNHYYYSKNRIIEKAASKDWEDEDEEEEGETVVHEFSREQNLDEKDR
jgi:hypothetical protein